MADLPLGPILDGLGATLDLADGDLVESAVVIAKVVTAAGVVTVGMSDSTGLSWLDQLALITAAKQIVDSTPYSHPEDE